MRQRAVNAARVLVLLIVLTAPGAGRAQAATPRILLVGDSWVDQAWGARAFETALQNQGFFEVEEKGDVTAIGGTTAADWATPAFLALITQELQANPELDIVHLSVGGNDFLEAPPGTNLFQLFFQIMDDVEIIVAHIHSIRPNARIALSIYDYVPAGFNSQLAFFTQAMINHSTTLGSYFVINNLGVLHHAFGYPGEFGPGTTPLPGGFPDYVPLLGGDPNFPGSPAAFDDAIHPNDASYVRLAEHAIDEFYAAWLAPTPVPALGPGAVGLLAAALGLCGSRRLRL